MWLGTAWRVLIALGLLIKQEKLIAPWHGAPCGNRNPQASEASVPSSPVVQVSASDFKAVSPERAIQLGSPTAASCSQ